MVVDAVYVGESMSLLHEMWHWVFDHYGLPQGVIFMVGLVGLALVGLDVLDIISLDKLIKQRHDSKPKKPNYDDIESFKPPAPDGKL